MTVCKKIKRVKKQVCIGALDTLIELNNRAIVAPSEGSVDYDENFTPILEVFSYVETKTGVTIFDDSDTERNITHFFYIRFDATVTAETWIKLDGDLYDIHDVENIQQKSEFLLLRCNKRGLDTASTNFA